MTTNFIPPGFLRMCFFLYPSQQEEFLFITGYTVVGKKPRFTIPVSINQLFENISSCISLVMYMKHY